MVGKNKNTISSSDRDFLNKINGKVSIDFNHLRELDDYIGLILPSISTNLYIKRYSRFDFLFDGHEMTVFRVYLKSSNDQQYMLQFTFDREKTCIDILFCCLVVQEKNQNDHHPKSKINLKDFIPAMDITYGATIIDPLIVNESYSLFNKKNKKLYFYERDLSGGHDHLADMVEYLIIEETKKHRFVFLAVPLGREKIKTKILKDKVKPD